MKTPHFNLLAVLMTALTLYFTGCSSSSSSSTNSNQAKQQSAAAAPCTPLPGTGLCGDRAAALLPPADAASVFKAPDKCEWTVQELAMPVDEFLLYRAAKCDGKVTTLTFEGGAHMAELKYETSAYFGNGVKGRTIVKIIGAGEGADPNSNLLTFAREAVQSKAEAAKCSVRPAKSQGWPADALVVDISAAEAAKIKSEGPRSACGPYGLHEDSQSFWRVFQGFSWFFELGQDSADIDPSSFTLVKKDGKGGWTRS